MSTSQQISSQAGTQAAAEFRTSGLVRLTKPQLIGTLAGLMLTMLLAALDQTIVGTAEPRIIASLSGFNRYPWVATMYMLSSTMAIQWQRDSPIYMDASRTFWADRRCLRWRRRCAGRREI